MRMLDLFCGRFGWGRAFAARGWEVVGVDLVEPPEIPNGCAFISADILDLMLEGSELRWGKFGRGNAVTACQFVGGSIDGYPEICDQCDKPYSHSTHHSMRFDFICASSPCEKFSVHGMKHFHPHPPYPELGIKLFEHTRTICEASGVPYVMENVKAAEQFVGRAVHHCGPFYLWGTGIPILLHRGITKGVNIGGNLEFAGKTLEERRQLRAQIPRLSTIKSPAKRKEFTAQAATIPPELANCVADYAERIKEKP